MTQPLEFPEDLASKTRWINICVHQGSVSNAYTADLKYKNQVCLSDVPLIHEVVRSFVGWVEFLNKCIPNYKLENFPFPLGRLDAKEEYERIDVTNMWFYLLEFLY